MLSGRMLARSAAMVALGLLVGVVGTGVHRSQPPFGVGLALLAVLAAAVVARAWAGWLGVLGFGLGVVTTVGVLGSRGPGGDVLVAADAVGYTWYAGALLVMVAALLPGRWFSDRPLEGRRRD